MPVRPSEVSSGILGELVTMNAISAVSSGAAFSRGDLLAIAGMNGASPTVELASASDVHVVLWVAQEAILASGQGLVTGRLVLQAVDTSAAAVGDPVYLSDTPGAWSLSPGTNSLIIGQVLTVGSSGDILINTTGNLGSGVASAAPLPWGWVRGGSLNTVSGLTFNVEAFEARDQSDQLNIVKASSTAMNLATQGAGGKDYAGATLSSALAHCLYAISSEDGATVSCIASLDWTAPTLPIGYTKYVCIGFLAVTSTTVLIPEYRNGNLYMYDYTLGTIPQNAETLLSTSNLTNFASGRFTGAFVELRNTTNVGSAFVAVRRISGGTNWIETASGLQSRYADMVPLSQDNIITFSSALLQTGTARLKGLYFTRGAK